MNYFIYFLYILVSCFAYQNNYSGPVVMGASFCILMFLFYFFKKEGLGSSAIFLILMCLSIPTSFRNILGGSFGEFPLTWFYLLGLGYVVSSFYDSNQKKMNYYQFLMIYLLIFSIIPILKATSVKESIGEYITYGFFLVSVFEASRNQNSLSSLEYNVIKKVYIFAVIISALGIIFQFLMYSYFNKMFLWIEFYGGGRTYYGFLFNDMSTSTLYMASAILFLFLDKKNIRWRNFLLIGIILIGMILSSARAGIITLFLVLFLYVISRGSFTQRIMGFLITFSIAFFCFFIFTKMRYFDTGLDFIIDDSGRIQGYIDGLNYFFSSPIIGTGYDLGFRMKQVGQIVPHFAVINMLGQTGIIITTLFIVILINILDEARNKNLNELYWIIILSFLGSCIVPGFFSSRYFTVIAMLVFLKKKRDEGVDEKKSTRYPGFNYSDIEF